MFGKSGDTAESCNKQEPSWQPDVTDVYICVFFDGTANNCYEELHKKEEYLKERNSVPQIVISFSVVPDLFSSDVTKYGMTNFQAQKEQAERDLIIEDVEKRGDLKVTKENAENASNGSWKYSNVAVLRSLTRKKPKESVDGKVGIVYNLYIEGVGRFWDGKYIDKVTDTHPIHAGMGIGRTGVVGLVSKTMVLVEDFLDSVIPYDKRESVNIHFAVWGFSRGSTCGRLFSFLITEDNINEAKLPKTKEFKQYLPQTYYKNDTILFLKEYKNKTVDFLGIFDTVSSIGFLRKDDTSTNYGVNRFGKKWGGDDNENVNHMHSLFRMTFSDAANNYHCDNAHNYGLYSPKNCKHTFHICAIDEFRENFAIVDLGKNLKGTTCTEVFMPGCHSDIGGGYMYNDGGENDLITLRRTIAGKNTKLIISPDPQKEVPSEALSQEVMMDLGWFTNVTSKNLSIKNLRHGIEYNYFEEEFALENLSKETVGQIHYIKQDDETIDFKRFAKEGYSNISLNMMKNRALSNTYGLKGLWPDCFLPFEAELPSRFKISEDDTLKPIIKQSTGVFSEGQRHWIIPTKEEYKKLRQEYLHFSCTDKLHKGADFGNPPNWVKRNSNGEDYYLLCRLVYHGGANDDHGLHDMKDLPKE